MIFDSQSESDVIRQWWSANALAVNSGTNPGTAIRGYDVYGCWPNWGGDGSAGAPEYVRTR